MTKVQRSVVPVRLCLAVAACTLATLLLELALTRIFSVVLYYHFAFLAISVALFGLGAGGILAYFLPTYLGLWNRLGRLCTVNAVLVAAVLLIILHRPLVFTLHWTAALVLVMVYLICAFPFLLAGMVVSIIIAKSVHQVGRVYFYDLLGAALGCLLLVPLLEWVGGPGAVITSGAFFAFAGALLYSLDGLGRRGVKLFLVAAQLVPDARQSAPGPCRVRPG